MTKQYIPPVPPVPPIPPTVTFVTAFLDLNEDRSKDRTPETRISLFKHIADSGVAICLFVSSTYEYIGTKFANEYKNVKLMPVINIEDLETYKLIKSYNPILPITKTDYHDTLNFMILNNSKSEFLYNVTLANPFNTSHFAWIDFSICHVIKNIEHFKSNLHLFGYSNLKDTMLVFPSCWSLEKSKELINNITMSVNWRFCGGFFIGDKISIQNMHFLMLQQLPNFIIHTGTNIIVWEVNVWAWLEINCNWKINYYSANHDDTILHIPKEYISVVASLTSIPSRFKECKFVIDSIINQVDYIYLNLCNEYIRFKEVSCNDLLNEINYLKKDLYFLDH